MSFKRFLNDKLLTISLLLFGLFTIEICLLICPVGVFIKIYIPIIILGFYGLGIGIEYLTKKRFYKKC